jgi:hypothetical protein
MKIEIWQYNDNQPPTVTKSNSENILFVKWTYRPTSDNDYTERNIGGRKMKQPLPQTFMDLFSNCLTRTFKGGSSPRDIFFDFFK